MRSICPTDWNKRTPGTIDNPANAIGIQGRQSNRIHEFLTTHILTTPAI